MLVAGAQHSACRLHSLLQLFERLLRVPGKDTARGSERRRADASLEHREPEQLLERSDVGTDARLRQVDRAGRRAEAAALCDGEEAPQPRDFEEHRVAKARVGEPPASRRSLIALEVGRIAFGVVDAVWGHWTVQRECRWQWVKDRMHHARCLDRSKQAEWSR